MVELKHVRRAADALEGVANRTPVLTSRLLDRRVGGQVWLKAEQFQRTGSFKFRGAYNRLLHVAGDARGVITASSGNHGQGLALAGRLLGLPVTVMTPHDASALKVAAAQAYGATVVRYDRYADDSRALLLEQAAERGLEPIHAFDDPHVIAGQGTVGLELLDQTDMLDLVVVCVGGGGLMSGCATAAKAVGGDVEVIGVQPAANNAAQRSWTERRRVALPVAPSIADGQQVPAPGEITLPVMLERVDHMCVVSEDEIRSAMRFALETLKVVLEPSGATTLAAILAGKIDVRGRRVGVTLSGGNVDATRFAELIGGHA